MEWVPTRQVNSAVVVGGLTVCALSRAEWVNKMLSDCANAPLVPRLWSSVNGNVISKYHREPDFRHLVNQMDGLDVDGMPIVLASRLFYREPIPERVATTDFFHDAATEAERKGINFFLLGGTPETNEIALLEVRRQYPRLLIKGHHGYFQLQEEPRIIREILGHKTGVLWVGLGVPLEQAFVVRNRCYLRGVSWVKTCGGLLDFLSGKNKRAPKWMQTAGLEWLYRTWREPRRLWWRYLTTNPHALYHLIRSARIVTPGSGDERTGRE